MLDIVSTPAILISPSNETRQTTWYKKIYDEWDTFMRGRGCMSGTAQPKPLCEAPRYCQKLNDHAKSEKTIARLKYENGLQDKHVQRQFQEIGKLRASHQHSRRQSRSATGCSSTRATSKRGSTLNVKTAAPLGPPSHRLPAPKAESQLHEPYRLRPTNQRL